MLRSNRTIKRAGLPGSAARVVTLRAGEPLVRVIRPSLPSPVAVTLTSISVVTRPKFKVLGLARSTRGAGGVLPLATAWAKRTAFNAFRRPYPKRSSRPGSPRSSVSCPASRAWVKVSTVSVGSRAFMRAATPAT